jgi:hypothetical protein
MVVHDGGERRRGRGVGKVEGEGEEKGFREEKKVKEKAMEGKLGMDG